MIGLDTNVLIRYLTQDDAKQAEIATRLIEKKLTADQPGFISHIVLVEVVWVLLDSYGASTQKIQQVIEGLLTTRQFTLQEPQLVAKALRGWLNSGADFSDALICEIAKQNGCKHTFTFDKKAARLQGMELL